MSSDRKAQSPAEKLKGIEHVLVGTRKRIKRLCQAIQKTEVRLKGATKEVVQRRFTRDLREYTAQLDDLRGKEAWARRTIDQLKMVLSCDTQGRLKHNPFAALTLKG